MTKKNLSERQVYKKYKLLDETYNKIKGKNKKEISHIWQNYRKKKFTIENLPQLKQKKRKYKDNPEKVQEILKQYYDRKEIAVKKIEFGGLMVTKTVKSGLAKGKYYKTKKNIDLDETLKKLFQNPKIKYVLVTLKIRITSTGQILYVSDTFTEYDLYNLQEIEADVMEKILDKMSHVAKYDGFELIDKFIRVIYENPQNSANKENNRSNKK